MSYAEAEGVDHVKIGFRPEALRLVAPGEGIAVTVDLVEELGADAYCYASLDDPALGGVDMVARVGPHAPPAVGERVHLAIRSAQVHAFSTVDGARY